MRPSTDMINTPCLIFRRTRSGAEDDYGDPIMDEELLEAVGEFQQRRADELGGTQVSRTDWVGYFFPELTLKTNDAIFDLETEVLYELDGTPWRARNSRVGEFEHLEVALTVVGGPGAALS